MAMEKCTESHIYHRKSGMIREQGSWYRSRRVERSAGRDVQRIQTAFCSPIETEKDLTLPYRDRGQTAHQCPGEGGVVGIARLHFFGAPTRQVDKGRGSQRVKGQSPRVAEHMHTPKHFISITNNNSHTHNITNRKSLCLF